MNIRKWSTCFQSGISTCTSACCRNDRGLCNTCHHCIRCSRTFRSRISVVLIQVLCHFRPFDTASIISVYQDQIFCLIGSGLPVIMGISFAYVPSMQSIAAEYDVAAILGAMIVGGAVAVFVGLFIRSIRRFFPPLITGTVVFTIGLSLYPTAINYMAGGTGSKDYGSWQNWLVRRFPSLTIVTVLNHFGKGASGSSASILIGIIGGYIIALFFGMV